MLYRKEMMNKEEEEVILKNSNLIYSIINKYTKYYDVDDLYQTGVIGILKAYKNYDSSKNCKFSTYAYTYILGEVLKYVNNNRNIKLSSEYLMINKKIQETRTILTQRLMKEPSNFELALFLEIDESVINNIDFLTKEMDSLDRIINEDGKSLMLLDTIKDNRYENNVDFMLLHDEIEKLPNDEKRLLMERYFYDKTQSEISKLMGVNQVQVSRCEKKILKKLKNNLCRPL